VTSTPPPTITATCTFAAGIEEPPVDASVLKRVKEHAQVVAEHLKTDPHWPRWKGAPPPGIEPEPAKKPRSKR